MQRSKPLVTRLNPRTFRELSWFFALTLGTMFVCCLSFAFAKAPLSVFFDRCLGGLPAEVLLLLAAFSPSAYAILITAVNGGRFALRRLLRQIFRLDFDPLWIAVSLLFFPALWLVWAVVQLLLQGMPIRWEMWYSKMPLLFLGGFIFRDTGAFGEEVGWRGFAMSRLLEGYQPVVAAVIVGLMMGLWHLPAWFLAGESWENVNFLLFLGCTVCLSVFMGWFYLNMKGSILFSGMIPHTMLNLTGEKSAGMYVFNWSFLAFFAASTLLFIWLTRRKMTRSPPFEPRYMLQYYSADEERAAEAARAGLAR